MALKIACLVRKFEHLRSRRFFISMLDLETFSFLLFERLVIGHLFDQFCDASTGASWFEAKNIYHSKA